MGNASSLFATDNQRYYEKDVFPDEGDKIILGVEAIIEAKVGAEDEPTYAIKIGHHVFDHDISEIFYRHVAEEVPTVAGRNGKADDGRTSQAKPGGNDGKHKLEEWDKPELKFEWKHYDWVTSKTHTWPPEAKELYEREGRIVFEPPNEVVLLYGVKKYIQKRDNTGLRKNLYILENGKTYDSWISFKKSKDFDACCKSPGKARK